MLDRFFRDLWNGLSEIQCFASRLVNTIVRSMPGRSDP